MKSFFISDCHLAPDRPQVVDYFVGFAETLPEKCDRLFILGDFFDVWIGSARQFACYERLIASLKNLSSKIPVFFMRGNRDFLIDESFAAMTGCNILDDVHIEVLDGIPVLLLHGDLLCTDDHAYQRYRRIVRHPLTRYIATHSSLILREWVANNLRKRSQKVNKEKPASIMDVNQQTVERYMQKYGVDYLIHGHTHRPNIHDFELDGKRKQRIVLGDWYHDGSLLEFEKGTAKLNKLNIADASSWGA